MGWLDDLNKERVFIYESTEGTVVKGNLDALKEWCGVTLNGEPNETFEFEGETFERKGFEPTKLSMSTKVAFEQNGRKGYKIGNDYISATKENYMKTGDTRSVLSKSYEREMNSKIDDAMNFYEKDQKRFEKTKLKPSVSISKATSK